jgi:phospho-N-acetylmuramoyl-pentapeptide-transferase
MLHYFSSFLETVWGPFRLLRSHAWLLAVGTLLAAFAVVFLLPKLWAFLPHDHGKAILGKDGMKSAGKPTSAGLWVTLLVLPIVLLVTPLTWAEGGVLFFLYLAMMCGFLDDRSEVPWGQLKKGVLDCVASLGVAACLYWNQGGEVWLPFVKGVWSVPWWLYVPGAGFLLFVVMNATNCSDGVDGLAGSLTLISLVFLAALLYLVVGYAPVARYLLVPMNPAGARWAILLMTVAGGFAGYLWWNAEPSKVLMGDAGSRFLGLLLGAGVLVTGNPLLILAFAPVVLVNGGGGMVKILLLRFFRKCGLDVRPPSMLPPEALGRRNVLVRIVQCVRFPLHDHCKKELKWSNAQVLMRFMLLQAFLTPLLFILFVKVR